MNSVDQLPKQLKHEAQHTFCNTGGKGPNLLYWSTHWERALLNAVEEVKLESAFMNKASHLHMISHMFKKQFEKTAFAVRNNLNRRFPKSL